MSQATVVTLLPYAAAGLLTLLLTLRKPAWALCALIVAIPFDSPTYIESATTAQFSKAMLLGICAALLLKRSSLRPLFSAPVRGVVLAAIAVAVAACISVLHADYRGEALRQSFKAAEYLATFAVAAVIAVETRDRKAFYVAFGFVALLVTVAALADEAGRAHSFALVRGKLIPRIAGALEGPNQLSGFYDVTIPLLLSAFALPTPLFARERVVFGGLLALGTMADILTLSRAGFVAVLLGCGTTLARSADLLRTPRARTIVAVAAVMLVAVFLASGASGRFRKLDFSESTGETGLGTRAELWGAAIALWHTSPLIGIGAGNYEFELARANVTDAQTHANSLPLQTLAEEGMCGETALLALAAFQLATYFRFARGEVFALAAFGATLALDLHQVVDDLIFFPKVGLEWWIVCGIAVGMIASGLSASERALR